jgi:hypothetical protein
MDAKKFTACHLQAGDLESCWWNSVCSKNLTTNENTNASPEVQRPEGWRSDVWEEKNIVHF